MAPLVATATTQDMKFFLQWYGTQRYNADSVRDAMRKVYNWSVAHRSACYLQRVWRVQTIYPCRQPPALPAGFRTAIDQYHFGWAVWDYDEALAWPGILQPYAPAFPNGKAACCRHWDYNKDFRKNQLTPSGNSSTSNFTNQSLQYFTGPHSVNSGVAPSATIA